VRANAARLTIETMNDDGRPIAAPLSELTPREIDVLRQAATGRSNADVAAALGVSVHAVKFHLASIFRKLHVHNRTEAAATYLAAMPDELARMRVP
jgi:DNA-binding NarL/FixJ family response regulator